MTSNRSLWNFARMVWACLGTSLRMLSSALVTTVRVSAVKGNGELWCNVIRRAEVVFYRLFYFMIPAHLVCLHVWRREHCAHKIYWNFQ